MSEFDTDAIREMVSSGLDSYFERQEAAQAQQAEPEPEPEPIDELGLEFADLLGAAPEGFKAPEPEASPRSSPAARRASVSELLAGRERARERERGIERSMQPIVPRQVRSPSDAGKASKPLTREQLRAEATALLEDREAQRREQAEAKEAARLARRQARDKPQQRSTLGRPGGF